jgi:hypothetical protein
MSVVVVETEASRPGDNIFCIRNLKKKNSGAGGVAAAMRRKRRRDERAMVVRCNRNEQG